MDCWAHKTSPHNVHPHHPPQPQPQPQLQQALLFLNRHPSSNAGLLWGDKDTFWLAAALVGKAHCYNQVAVPPCEC